MSKNRDFKYFTRFVDGVTNSIRPYNFKDKTTCITYHSYYMFARTQSMFKWTGLPDTIPHRILELYLQINGNCCFYRYENNLYVFVGGMGGEPDYNYMPTIYTIANPALKISRNLRIDKDCVVIPNDSLYLGLMPLFSRYSTAIVENEISLLLASLNSRIVNLISAPDDRSKASAEIYLKHIEEGTQGIIAENPFLDGIKSQPYGNTSTVGAITSLIEMEQYLKASWYNELGLNANYNMKRESLNTTESQMNNDALLPLVDDMLRQRREGAKKVNDMFGTNITVDLNSSWKITVEEMETDITSEIESKNESENEIENTEPDGKEDDDDTE